MESFNNSEMERWGVPCIEKLFSNDPQLRRHEKDIRKRYGMFEKTKMCIDEQEGMDRFSESYKDYGLVVGQDGGLRCREWAPNARAVYIKGQFNNWERLGYEEVGFGKWELYIPPNSDRSCPIKHLSELKLVIETKDNQSLERVSPWAEYVVQRGNTFRWLFWNPPRNQTCHELVRPRLPKPSRLRIYEAHIGIGSDRCEVSSYRHFTSEVLPRIRELGYNCVLLMAIMEHQNYSSAGYQVSNYFAASSRFGTPEDLKELIKVAHEMGLYVIMDVMHGRVSKNSREGLNFFDGSDDCFFRPDHQGSGEENGVRKFDHKKWEVLRFLLSNLRHYMDRFRFDGFRFSDVTSMIYQGRSEVRRFTDDYRQYFGMHMNLEAQAYLMLANDMIHRYYPNAITIADEHSGFPSLTRSVREGGFGFDYRVADDIPEQWMKMLCECRDENWSMERVCSMMSQRRPSERYVTYPENHKQSMYFKKPLALELMGEESMIDKQQLSIKLDRGMSLHKMIRLITSSFAGQAYMNFMGNEFGHPGWVELSCPQKHNKHHQLSRREFRLADDNSLTYKFLNRFDAAMNRLEQRFAWLQASPASLSRQHNDDKVIVFERAGLVFIFNFHPTKSFPDYRIGIQRPGKYRMVLDSDDKLFGGHGRNQSSVEFHSQSQGCDNRSCSLMVYLPSRCAIVLASDNLIHHSGNSYGGSGNSYGTSGNSYGTSGNSYGTSGNSYASSGNSFGTSGNSYGSSGNSYGSSDNSYGSSDNSYGTSGNSYGSSGNSYGTSDNSYGTSGNSYGTSDNSYGASGNSYGASGNSYGTSGNSYGTSGMYSGDNLSRGACQSYGVSGSKGYSGQEYGNDGRYNTSLHEGGY